MNWEIFFTVLGAASAVITAVSGITFCCLMDDVKPREFDVAEYRYRHMTPEEFDAAKKKRTEDRLLAVKVFFTALVCTAVFVGMAA